MSFLAAATANLCRYTIEIYFVSRNAYCCSRKVCLLLLWIFRESLVGIAIINIKYNWNENKQCFYTQDTHINIINSSFVFVYVSSRIFLFLKFLRRRPKYEVRGMDWYKGIRFTHIIKECQSRRIKIFPKPLHHTSQISSGLARYPKFHFTLKIISCKHIDNWCIYRYMYI